MKGTQAFSVNVPQVGERIEVVEFGGKAAQTAGPLESVNGPFRIDRHDSYECTIPGGASLVIFHIQPGEALDWETKTIVELLAGTK